MLAEVVLAMDELGDNVGVEIDFAEEHSGCDLSNLSVGYLVKLLFFIVGNVDDVVWYFSKEDEHDSVSQKEENAGIQGKDQYNFFPEG